jgi:biotin operon repressor
LLETLITSKTRLRLLIRFFVVAANKGYLNGLAQEFGESTNAIRKELNHLAEAGYLIKSKENNKIQYLANTAHPLFSSLQKIVWQHLGLEFIAEQVIERMGNVEVISLVGDYAKGIDSGTIEIRITGDQLNEDYFIRLSKKLSSQLKRNVKIEAQHDKDMQGIILYLNENKRIG